MSRVFNWLVVFVFLAVVVAACTIGNSKRVVANNNFAYSKVCKVYITGNSPALYDNYLEVFQSLGCTPVATKNEATLLATARREEWRSDCGSNLRARLLVYSRGNLMIDKSSTVRCISYSSERVSTAVILLDLLVRDDFTAYQRAIRPLL